MCLKERILTCAEASDCDQCGRPVGLGDDCYVDLDSGGIWCSQDCADSAEETRVSRVLHCNRPSEGDQK